MITTLGLVVGLDFSTGSRLAVIGGIITIAIADAFSDALGMHISRESDRQSTQKGVWESTFSTFIAKFIVALIFALPVVMLPLQEAVWVCVAIGILLLSSFSYYIAVRNRENPLSVVAEHLTIATVVLVVSALVGSYVRSTFGS